MRNKNVVVTIISLILLMLVINHLVNRNESNLEKDNKEKTETMEDDISTMVISLTSIPVEILNETKELIDNQEVIEILFRAENITIDSVDVYTTKECVETSKVDTIKSVETIENGGTIVKIKPNNAVLGSKLGDINKDKGWGNASDYFIGIKHDTMSENLMLLKEKEIRKFKVNRDIEAPNLKFELDENNNLSLAWNNVDNAKYYRIYTILLDEDKSMNHGYKNKYPLLEVELDNTTHRWNDWIKDGTNGLYKIDKNTVLAQNIGIHTDYEYLITAVNKDGIESVFSNTVSIQWDTNKYEIYTSIDKNSEVFTKKKFKNTSKLPKTVNVLNLDGEMIELEIQFKLDKNTVFKKSGYYKYKVIGTSLKGYVKVGNINE